MILVSHPETDGLKFQKLSSKPLLLRRFSTGECDEENQQYEFLLRELKNYLKNDCSTFHPLSQRLDNLYFELLHDQFSILWKVIKTKSGPHLWEQEIVDTICAVNCRSPTSSRMYLLNLFSTFISHQSPPLEIGSF